MGLDSLGISSIGLDGQTVGGGSTGEGNTVKATSVVTHDDGTETVAGDVVLGFMPAATSDLRRRISPIMRAGILGEKPSTVDAPPQNVLMEKTRLKLVNAMAGFNPSFSSHDEQWHQAHRLTPDLLIAAPAPVHFQR